MLEHFVHESEKRLEAFLQEQRERLDFVLEQVTVRINQRRAQVENIVHDILQWANIPSQDHIAQLIDQIQQLEQRLDAISLQLQQLESKSKSNTKKTTKTTPRKKAQQKAR